MNIDIQRIPVSFPYKPYSCQLSIMNRVIEALESKRHCLIESPTGTGKSLALLCASLAWLNDKAAQATIDKGVKAEADQDRLDYDPEDDEIDGKENLPKIYFCTRTHKQLSQLIDELRRTRYRSAKMTVLGSRTHTCINPDIQAAPNPVEACRNLMLSTNCPFDQPRRRYDLVKAVNGLDAGGPWDLEDLVQAVSSSDIDIHNHIVIIDEAHNIEDASREAASFKITDNLLNAALDDLEGLRKHNIEPESCSRLIEVANAMLRVIQLTHSRLVRSGQYAESTHVWTGQEIVGLMATVGLKPDQVIQIQKAHSKLSSIASDDTEAAAKRHTDSANQPVDTRQRPASATLFLVKSLLTVLSYMFRNNQQHISDFRVVLMESITYDKQAIDRTGPSGLSNWLSKSTPKSRYVELRELSLNFWCLNPALVFADLASRVHCLILMSGTLSPLATLQVELGVDFPLRLEANHVIGRDRLLVASLSHGPSGSRLCATYQHQSTFAFQDEVGHLLLEACQLVPGGVLCFLPSYSLLDKLSERWENTGMLERLGSIKHVMFEPRSSSGLEAWIGEFRSVVDKCASSSGSRRRHTSKVADISGALVLAVCRGKVSEGLDFSDAYARLVVSIGIPYPAFNNPQVQQKRAYNDLQRSSMSMTSSHISSPKPLSLVKANDPASDRVVPMTSSSSGRQTASTQPRNVLSGSDWYDAQAYRALNQALGRCIRHTNDWGAVLLADARFVEQPQRYTQGISRWMRARLTPYHRWNMLADDLHQFIAQRCVEEEEENVKIKATEELEDIFD